MPTPTAPLHRRKRWVSSSGRRVARQLDAFAAGGGPPLVLAGEPGAGASAIASAWLARWRTDHPDDAIIEHHVGATADSSEWSAMAVRLVGELARQHGFEGERAEPPADARGRRAALFAAIARAGSLNRRTMILVDGADLLTDIDGAPDLTWLPTAVPPAIRVIVTTSGERPVEAAQRRGWTVVTVPPLDEAERRDFIRVFLGRYAKSLDEIHVARLVGTASTGNALFLRTVLDELRQHGRSLHDRSGHRTLSRRGDARRAARAGARTVRGRLRA